MVAHCFESDPCELLARVHDKDPFWTRLELTKGGQDNFRMARLPGLNRRGDGNVGHSNVGPNPIASGMRVTRDLTAL